ncbi:hypothetical protein HGB07_04875, partial [Candidatus Roizmanbacteria bacterium]|nr:hypothetical protein [Candidatus Roizmanbacteria bacterium]
MGKILLAIIIVASAIASLSRPWVGILSYYLLAVLGPQYIWWWNFEGLRVSFIVAVFALAGVGIKLLQRQFDFSFLTTKLNLYVLLLWLFVTVSYYFGPYVSDPSFKNFNPDALFSASNKIFLFYFCAALALNDIKKIRYLSLILLVTTIYFIYWANNQYLSENWMQFNMGRLMGPADIFGGSIYKDENALAILFVTGIP